MIPTGVISPVTKGVTYTGTSSVKTINSSETGPKPTLFFAEILYLTFVLTGNIIEPRLWVKDVAVPEVDTSVQVVPEPGQYSTL